MAAQKSREAGARSPRLRKTRRVALWILGSLLALGLLFFAVLAAGGWWVESRFLRHEIRFGEGGVMSVRAHGARFEWTRLNFRADSVWYRSPGLEARTGATEIRVDWIGGLMALRPATRLEADSLYLRLRADTTEKDPKPLDSLVFPDFSLPLAVRVRIRGVVIEDDSGFLAGARLVSARSRGGRRAGARVDSARSRWTGRLILGARASLDWTARDSVGVRLAVSRDTDRIRLTGRHAKRPLWKGRDSLSADIRNAGPYLTAFGLDGNLPEMGGIRLRAFAAIGDSLDLSLRLKGRTGTYRANPDFVLSPQELDVGADWRGGRGALAVISRGAEGEDIRINAEGRLLPKPPDRDMVPAWERLAASLNGHARGLRVRVRDTLRTADLAIGKASWDGRRVAVDVVTGDSSHLRAAGSLAGSPRDRNATFTLRVHPDERWVKVFAGDFLSFAGLDARGEYRREVLTAEVAARRVEVYGFQLDSLRSFHAYGPAGYELKPSSLYADGTKRTRWILSGTFIPGPSAPLRDRGRKAVGGRPAGLFATLENTRHGRLTYALAPDGTMEATAARFEAGALPYPLLDSLPIKEPVLDGSFRWNPARKTGRTDLRAKAKYGGKNVEAAIAGVWDARRMELARASLRHEKSELNASARLRLNGRQFYEAWKVKPAQYEQASVETPRLDLAEVLAAVMPDYPLESGVVRGSLSYSDGAGFDGSLVFSGVVPRDAVGDVVLKELRLDGDGDTLSVTARTTSESNPLFNASLRLGVASVLGDEQRVHATLVVADSLRILLDAATRRFQSLRGTLAASGRAALPEKSGSLEGIDVLLDFDVPVADPVRRATAATRTFEGVYLLPGLARQSFSLNAVLRGGTFRIAPFSVKNDKGQSLGGTLEYELATGALKAHLEGERFTAQWADDYKADLRGLRLDLTRDDKGLRAEGGFTEASFLYADAPLRAEGTLSRVHVDYRRPPSAARGARGVRLPADLALTATLSESLIRYRLKTFSDIQKVFRKEQRRRSSGPPLRLNVKVQTLGNRNRIDSDMLRLTWVGDLSVRGIHPYTLYNGRVNGLSGSFGLERQSYDIRRLEVKWLNAPLEEGRIAMESRKKLASDCGLPLAEQTDSCTVITRLDGEVGSMQFSYDSDCGGAYGAGANVAAMLYSVQRGCYDPSLVSGSEGPGYGSRALTLLESPLSNRLSQVFGRYSGAWIEQAEVTGLGSLSQEDKAGDSLGQALSLGITSREFSRQGLGGVRLKLRSGRHVASEDLSNPWEHMFAIEWRTPADALVTHPEWKRRLRDNLRAVASLQTKPVRISNPEEDEVEKKIGLNYTYGFWGNWWARPRKGENKDER
jgi:hypothetical protein